jgi:hypothetical protein
MSARYSGVHGRVNLAGKLPDLPILLLTNHICRIMTIPDVLGSGEIRSQA